MKSKFKVGDKVAVYYNGSRHVGIVAKIGDIYGDDIICVDFKESGLGWFHPKQLRKLVKKEAREWDVYLFKNGSISIYEYNTVKKETGTPIRVREVKVKK